VADTVTQDQRSRGVAERTDSVQTHRYSVLVEATQRELRLCGFALLNYYLTTVVSGQLQGRRPETQ